MAQITIRPGELAASARTLGLADRVGWERRVTRENLRRILAAVLATRASEFPVVLPRPKVPPFDRPELQEELLRLAMAGLAPVDLVFDQVPWRSATGDPMAPIDWREWLDRPLGFWHGPAAWSVESPGAPAGPPVSTLALLDAWFALAGAWERLGDESRAIDERAAHAARTLAEAREHQAKCLAELDDARRHAGDDAPLAEKTRRIKRGDDLAERARQDEATVRRHEEALEKAEKQRRDPCRLQALRAPCAEVLRCLCHVPGGPDIAQKVTAEAAQLGSDVLPPDGNGRLLDSEGGVAPGRDWLDAFREANHHALKIVQEPGAILVERRVKPRSRTRAISAAIAVVGSIAGGTIWLTWPSPARLHRTDGRTAESTGTTGSSEASPGPAVGVDPTHSEQSRKINMTSARTDPTLPGSVPSWPAYGHESLPDEGGGSFRIPGPTFPPVRPEDLKLPLRRCPLTIAPFCFEEKPRAADYLLVWLDPGMIKYLGERFTVLRLTISGAEDTAEFALPSGPGVGMIQVPPGFLLDGREIRVEGVTRLGARQLVYQSKLTLDPTVKQLDGGPK